MEELVRSVERAAEERNAAGVVRVECVSRLLESMDSRIGGLVETFERKGERTDDVMSAQRVCIEAWKRSGATVLKEFRQVVAGAGAGAGADSSVGGGGSSAEASGRQETRASRRKEATVVVGK